MKNILHTLKIQLKHDFSSTLPLAVIIWVGFLIAVNYRLDLEDTYIDTLPHTGMRWLGMFMLQAIPYAGVCLLLWIYGIDRNWPGSRQFWIFFLVGFSIIATDRAVGTAALAAKLFQEPDYYFLSKVFSKGKGIVTVIIPLILFALATDSNQNPTYFGLRGGVFKAKPYLLMLAVTAFFIAATGFFTDIQAHYPRYLHSYGPEFAELHSWHPAAAMLLYEVPYGFDFISTEYFFRGFLIIGMSKLLGKEAILPMVATYAALHFGKPLTETISSVFGGYILGVLALQHRNIWGGVMIHVGVAWLMEVVAYLHRIY